MQLYLLSMGIYNYESEVIASENKEDEADQSHEKEGVKERMQSRAQLTERKRFANQELNQVAGLSVIGQLLSLKLTQLDKVDRKKFKGQH